MNFAITQAQTSDSPRMLDFMYSCKKDLEQDGFLEFSKETEKTQLDRVKKYIEKDRVYIVKFKDKIIASVGILNSDPSKYSKEKEQVAFPKDCNFNYVSRLLVTEEHRRKGLARKLTDHIGAISKEESKKFLKTEIDTEDTMAVKATEALGFKNMGKGTLKCGDCGDVCYLFEKKLD
jgi:predicted GNAT superfamily acetyltransferase